MQKKVLFFFVVIASFVSSAKELKVSLGTSIYQNVLVKHKDGFEKDTGIKLLIPNEKDVAANASKRSANDFFKDVLEGKSEAAIASVSFDDWVKEMSKIGISVPKDVTYKVVGRDLMNVYIHPDLKLRNLTHGQLGQIFSGEKTNWSDFGEAAVPIKLVFATSKSVTNATFKKIVLKGKEIKGEIIDVDTFEKIVNTVIATPGAIGFGPAVVKSNKVGFISTEPIGRPITVVVKGRISENLKRFIEFMEKKGK